jgi:hypothetical protein
MHHYLLTFEDEGGQDNRTLVSASSRDEAIALWRSTRDEEPQLEALISVWELPPIADQPTVHFWLSGATWIDYERD